MTLPFNKKLSRFNDAMTLREMMEAAGVAGDPTCEDLWRWSLSPLSDSRHAEKFQQHLLNTLGPRLLAKQYAQQEIRISADVPDSLAVLLGFQQLSGQELKVERDKLGHVLVIGKTGAGKTSFIFWIIQQLIAHGIRVVFHDHKGEGRRLTYWIPDAIVFRPEQEFLNALAPVGPAEMYWTALFAELGRALGIHVETWTEGAPLMQQIQLGLKPGQPYPSWRDLVVIMHAIAKKQRRPKLTTLARAVESLCVVIGKTASVRKGPDFQSKYRLIVYEYQHLPPRIHHFLTAIRQLRAQMHAMSLGHSHQLREVFVSDEAALEFGSEFTSVAGSNYVPIPKRIITQSRSFGIIVMAGAQMLSPLDDALKSNVTTIVCFCCPDSKEAREAQRMLMLPEDAIPQIMSLPPGSFFVRSAGFSHSVLATFPKVELGEYLSDAEIARRLTSEFSWLETNTIFSPAKTENITPVPYLEILGETTSEVSTEDDLQPPKQFFAEHRSLLNEIKENPTASVTEHYRNLHWSAGRGNRVKRQLIEMGLVIAERQESINGRPREILIITEKGKNL